MDQSNKDKKFHIILLISLVAIFIWSYIDCHDLLTWFLEGFPAVVGVAILLCVYHKFRFTNLSYILIWIFSVILLIGAHYTYARMPLFNWISEVFGLERNYYDRFGHFFQGVAPALLGRELLLRTSALKPSRWLCFIIVCICLAISAFYELLEWLVVVVSGDKATAFLATQGDPWDPQKDMALCLVGAIIGLLALSKLHDKGLEKIG